MMTHDPLRLVDKDRKHFAGTSTGNLIGPAELPDLDVGLQLLHKDKKGLWGGARVECGGVVPGDNPTDDESPNADDTVPLLLPLP